jgi:2-polyprenyl-3-methyl-5-hydroxy-6-metoxy-1,4-benzoquinol methylase
VKSDHDLKAEMKTTQQKIIKPKEKNLFSYKDLSEAKSVDIKKLRPKGSYKFLIENRNHNTDKLLENSVIPKHLLHKINCHNCGSSESSSIFKKDGFDIVACNKCGLVYVSEILTEDFYEETYSSEKYADVVSKLGFDSHKYRKERFGSERIDKINEYIDLITNPSFLDVGCSTGFVVQSADERGWKSKGIDLNSHAVKFGKNTYKLNLTSENFFELTENFDCIGMYDVLEHVSNPRMFLEQAHNLLNSNGIIHIYVPNWNSASRYILGQDAHFIWPSHHLTYFTPHTLLSMVQSNGFKVIEMETEGLDFYDTHWMKQEGILEDKFDVSPRLLEILQFLANAGGHGKNLRCIAKKI